MPIDSKVYPNLLIRNAISSMESSIPFFYMEQHKYTLKNWIRYYLKKFNIKLNYHYDFLLSKMPNKYDESMEEICVHDNDDDPCDTCNECDVCYSSIGDWIKIKDHLNNIHIINACQMPDRKVLYDYLIDWIDDTKKIDIIRNLMQVSSPDDDGFKYCILHIINACNSNDCKKILIFTPSIYFRLFLSMCLNNRLRELKQLKNLRSLCQIISNISTQIYINTLFIVHYRTIK